MNKPEITQLRFSVSNWAHLYSLQQAILRAEKASGKTLSIHGKIRDASVLDNEDTPITVDFYQVDGTPNYSSDAHDQLVLGQMRRHPDGLHTALPVDASVFEEMRRNLMEYADIDGIHIIVSIGLRLANGNWPMQQSVDIIQLDYAMRGDA